MTGTLIQQLTALADTWEKADRHESAQELRRVIEQYAPACPVIVCKEPEAVEKMNLENGNLEPGPVVSEKYMTVNVDTSDVKFSNPEFKTWDITTPHTPTLKAIREIWKEMEDCREKYRSRVSFGLFLSDKIADLEGGK